MWPDRLPSNLNVMYCACMVSNLYYLANRKQTKYRTPFSEGERVKAGSSSGMRKSGDRANVEGTYPAGEEN